MDKLERYHILRYTQDAFKAINPEKTDEDWRLENYPDNIYDFLSYSVYLLEENGIELNDDDLLDISLIDENYFKYLRDNNIEDTEDERFNWVFEKPLSKKAKIEKLKKNNMYCAYTLLTIPVILNLDTVSSKPTNYKLTAKQKQELTEYLEKIYGKHNVYVYGCFANIMNVDDYVDKLIASGNLYFEKGIDFEIPELRRQHYDEPMKLQFLGIPYLIKSPVEDTSFTVKEIKRREEDIKYAPENIECFNQEWFRKYRIKQKNFTETELYNELTKDPKVTITPVAILIYEIEDYIIDIIKGLL